MTSNIKPQDPQELLRRAQIAYYDDADDKTCARLLWEATFISIQQLAAEMGHPCEDHEQAKEFARYLERERGGKVRYATSMLGFGLDMLDHAEDGWLSQEPEFAWTFPEFPLAIRATAQTVESLTAYARTINS